MKARNKNEIKWYKIGDITRTIPEAPHIGPVKIRDVSLGSPRRDASIIGITFSTFANKEVLVCLTLNHKFINLVKTALKIHFDESEYDIRRIKGCSVYITGSSSSSPKLLKLLKYLENELKRNEFSSKLILEIKQLFEYLNHPNPESVPFKHILLDNNLNSTTTKLIELVTDQKENFDEEYKTALCRGEDPNQVDINGYRFLYFVAKYFDVPTLELALIYYGNPFFVNKNLTGWSAVDYLLSDKAVAKLQCIENFFSPLTNSVAHIKAKLVKITHDKEQGTTTFHYSDNVSITEKIIPAGELRDKKWEYARKQMFNLYKNTFVSTSKDESIEQCFHDDVSEKNKKFIRLLTDKENVVGFVIFELLKIDKFQNHRIVHDVCCATEPNPKYSGRGLIALFTFDIGISLQLMTPKKMGIFYNAIHFNSNRFVRNLFYFPKYRSPQMDQLIRAILEKINGGTLRFVGETMTCYVFESLQVKESKEVRTNNPWAEFFNKNLKGVQNDCEISKSRSVPSFLYASRDLALQSEENVGGFNLEEYYKYRANYLLTAKPFSETVIDFLGENIQAANTTETLAYSDVILYGPARAAI